MQSKVRALDVRLLTMKRSLFGVLLALTLPYLTHCSQELRKNVKLKDFKSSQSLDEDDSIKPINPSPVGPNSVESEMFIEHGQSKIFADKDISLGKLSSLHAGLTNGGHRAEDGGSLINASRPQDKESNPKNMRLAQSVLGTNDKHQKNKEFPTQQLEGLVLEYVEDTLRSKSYKLFPERQTNSNNGSTARELENRRTRAGSPPTEFALDVLLAEKLYKSLRNYFVDARQSRALETGRLFLFKGLKKLLWPLFIGVQIAKTILLALFLPSILGSIGKMLGKGLSSVSGFNHPAETVSDFDFKDNGYNLDQDNTKYNDYAYPQAEASTNHFATQMYDAAAINNNALSRFGFGDQKATLINTGEGAYSSKNTNKNVMSGSKNSFQVFHDIPASSLLLSNYDPFYSPLLSRLDAVYQQLGLGTGSEVCREKLVCLMYSNPAKYAPYSNLVSAQLSRELNDLRKPTSDNPDILRFFKYMRAAKDGQDGADCEQTFLACTNFKDSENPAMLTTYHDINKLVQARKLNR